MKKIIVSAVCTICFSTLTFAYTSPFENGEIDIKVGENYNNSYQYTKGTYYLQTRNAQGVTVQADFLRNFSGNNALGLGIGYFSVPFQDNNLPGGVIWENSNFDIIPLYMVYRQQFSNWGAVIPYISYRLGYPATINHSSIISYYGGLYGGMSLGLKYDMFLVELQYNIAKLIIQNSSTTQNIAPNDYVMNGVSVVGGVSF